MLHVLVESNANVMLLLKLLQAEQTAGWLELRAAAPSSSLYAAARTLRIIRHEPVAVLLDARSPDPEDEDRVRWAAEEVIGVGVEPLRILVAVPALEAMFFARPDAVRRAYPAADRTLLEIGKVGPTLALQRLDPGGAAASLRLTKELDADDVAALRAQSPVKELLEFLEKLRRSGTVIASAGP